MKVFMFPDPWTETTAYVWNHSILLFERTESIEHSFCSPENRIEELGTV